MQEPTSKQFVNSLLGDGDQVLSEKHLVGCDASNGPKMVELGGWRVSKVNRDELDAMMTKGGWIFDKCDAIAVVSVNDVGDAFVGQHSCHLFV